MVPLTSSDAVYLLTWPALKWHLAGVVCFCVSCNPKATGAAYTSALLVQLTKDIL